MTMHKSAFVGFTKDGQVKADNVVSILRGVGLTSEEVFQFTQNPQKPMEDNADDVDAALEKHDAFILIFSNDARSSPWVSSELGQVKAYRKPLYLVKNTHNIGIELPDFMANYTYTVIGNIKKLGEYFGK